MWAAPDLMADMLRGVIDGGTAYGVRQLGFTLPAAGKTGTTDDYKDNWFVGFTPKYSTAVWVGYPQSNVPMGPNGFGGTLAAPIWHQYMVAASDGYCNANGCSNCYSNCYSNSDT